MVPLTIYLDSQDYITLFNSDRQSNHWQVCRHLLELRARGLIRIGYSAITLIEFVTKPTEKHKGERIERGRLVKKICGQNAFPFPLDLRKGFRFPNNGLWIPRGDGPVFPASLVRKVAKEEFERAISEDATMNRSEKRRLRSVGLREHLRVNSSGKSFAKEIAARFPVLGRIIDEQYFEDLLLGRITDRQFESAAMAWASDPELYSSIIYGYGGSDNVFDRFFSDSVRQYSEGVGGIQALLGKLKDFNRERLEKRRTLILSGMDRKEAKRITRELPNPIASKELDLTDLEEGLGAERVAHFKCYFERVKKPGFRFKRSDIMDLWQMLYAYECDLFRCDQDMYSIMKDYAPFNGRLSPKFLDLPQQIEAKQA